jgi:HlyD family secretion protein
MVHRPAVQLSSLVYFVLPLALALAGCSDSRVPQKPNLIRQSVTALGRIVPGRAVIDVASPPGERLASLSVREGLIVAQGDILATLATHETRQSELAAARVALAETRQRLDTETAFAHARIARAQATLALEEAQLDHERSELKRIESLRSGDAVTRRELDDQAFLARSRALSVARAESELAVARTALARATAAIGVESAQVRVQTAQARLELSLIRAPLAGTVLKVFTYPGELTNAHPILQLGATADMQVIAEVQVDDIAVVRVGQRATVTSTALAGPALGAVSEIGQLIYKNDVLALDPRAPRDTRVVEVRIKLDRAEPVAKLTNLEVDTRIDLRPAPPDS